MWCSFLYLSPGRNLWLLLGVLNNINARDRFSDENILVLAVFAHKPKHAVVLYEETVDILSDYVDGLEEDGNAAITCHSRSCTHVHTWHVHRAMDLI